MTCLFNCTTLTFKTLALGAMTATLLSATPAFAASQDDVQKCRASMAAQSNIEMSDYRLRFEREEGLRNRTLHFKAIPKKSGEAFTFTCSMKRSQVYAVNQTPKSATLLAKNETKTN